MHDATLTFEYADARRARLVARSVRREVGEIGGERTRATIAREDDTVRLRIRAEDLVGLRAGLNTWTALMGVAERVSEAA